MPILENQNKQHTANTEHTCSWKTSLNLILAFASVNWAADCDIFAASFIDPASIKLSINAL